MKEDHTFEHHLIKIGESAEDNDQIINQANQNDLWFHLKNLPSCHVVISSNDDHPITKRMINYCAKLCKDHTKYYQQKCKVMYTTIKHVQHAQTLGQVIIRGKHQTVTV